MKNSHSDVKLKIGKKEISAEKLLCMAENIFCDNYEKYTYNILPLAKLYCGSRFPRQIIMFAIGILAGMIIEKKKIKIEPNIECNDLESVIKLIKELKNSFYEKHKRF